MNIYKIVFDGIFKEQVLFYRSRKIPTYEKAAKYLKAYGFPDANIKRIEKI